MTIVIADIGPINYLVLIEEIGLLPRLFQSVTLPDAVADELRHPYAPLAVRELLAQTPPWLSITATPPIADTYHPELDRGERCAIALAESLPADLLLIDDRAGVAAAASHGIQSVGTVGLLVLAARRGFTDLPAAVSRLRTTNFRARPALLDELVEQYRSASATAPNTDR